MAKNAIPVGLPNSALLQALVKKTARLKTAPARSPAYLDWLKRLRDRIAPELSYTNITFPLFTPHDEQNHIHPLFTLTERLLGSKIIESLNATELFVLASSLYAHDWGMAVSEAEKKCIIGLVEPAATDQFALLEADRVAFAKLLNGRGMAEPKALTDVPIDVWQSYIRETHAARSAQRVRAFFSPIDANLGDAVALVSEAHNLDVERLRTFDTTLPLQGESANIRALALYLRLSDLFDIAQDRTPYALWKFVAPDNPKSAEEWNKHRALSPVIVERFQATSRCLKIRGATDDHGVYAALEDLREYCDNQLRLSNGLLNEINSRYQPNLLHLDWKVQPNGFEPITVRFEFERQAMINVLSQEIYQGDRYVFLRELLQNSIDAIRLRQALHQSKKTGVTFDGAIHVKVEHGSDGCATISWQDNGCGMNAFIVRNYLTVAGRSFYRSDDFRKLGVQMSPISRFGVGILSCFMVGDRLDVVTSQDPQLEASPEALKIEVHNPKRHLRIQRILSHPPPQVGTMMKVFVVGCAPNDQRESVTAKLEVTEYLKDIAGFVEFPIYVDENGRRTLIVHPERVGSLKKLEGWEVVSLNRAFAWQEFFVVQDVQLAREWFTEETITLKPTARNPHFEGTITYPVLKDDLELSWGSRSVHDEKAHRVLQGTKALGRVRVRRHWQTEEKASGKNRSIACNNFCRIYCDGVLVPGVTVPDWIDQGWFQPCTFRIVLNIRQTARTKLDLSRNQIEEVNHDWSDFVFQRCLESIRKRIELIIIKKTTKEALRHLARFVAYSSGFRDKTKEIIGNSRIPLIVLEKTGKIVVRNSKAFEDQIVRFVPARLARSLSKTVIANWGSSKWLQGSAGRTLWSGDKCVFAACMTYEADVDAPYSLRAVGELQKTWLDASCVQTAVRFLSPGERNVQPLMQPSGLMERTSKRMTNVDSQILDVATETKEHLANMHYSLNYGLALVRFEDPFGEFFTAGWNFLNVLHPVTKLLTECIKAIAENQAVGGISEHNFGRLRDALQPLFGEPLILGGDYLSGAKIEEKCEAIQRLFDLTSELKIFELEEDLPWKGERLNVPPVVKAGKLGAPIRSLQEVGLG